MTVFMQMLLGHLVGDFLFQPKWMALGKSERGWNGALICAVHVILYTLVIGVFADIWHLGFLLAVAVPHYIIDRNSLAMSWLRATGGRIPDNLNPKDIWDIPFTAIMYTVNDATIHLLFLYGALKMFVL